MVFRKHKPLKKELSLIDVYAIGTGAIISAGFFLLPGFAAAQAGPAVIIGHLLAARDEQELKELLLRIENFVSIHIKSHGKSARLIGRPLKKMKLPEDTLVAMINRNDRIIVPKGSAVLDDSDRIAVIGEPKGIKKFKEIYGGK